MRRAHVSLKTKLASALLALGDIPYIDAKQMTPDQLLSLYDWDHGVLHETAVALEMDPDPFWNLTPRLIVAHREKTKADLATIAKGRRIRKKLSPTARPFFDSLLTAKPTIKRKMQSRPFPKSTQRRSSWSRKRPFRPES